MLDLTKSIEPRSDQLNADDLITGNKTLVITSVKKGSAEQPINISYEGDEGKPYKPCKSMLRVMVIAWGKDGEKFVGESMRIYNDPKVKWAGGEVGGIRISHMSGIDAPLRVMVTLSRGKKVPCVIEPLVTKPKNKLTDEVFSSICAELEAADSMAKLSVIAKKIKSGDYDADGTKRLGSAYKDAQARVRGLNDNG